MAKRIQLSDGDRLWRTTRDGDRVTVEPGNVSFQVTRTDDDVFVVSGEAGAAVRAITAVSGDTIWVGIDGEVFAFRVARAGGAGAADDQALSPPMSATVVRIAVTVGDRVSAGDVLIALEAMKMELPIRAPREGTVQAIHCKEGELVQPGTPLVTIE